MTKKESILFKLTTCNYEFWWMLISFWLNYTTSKEISKYDDCKNRHLADSFFSPLTYLYIVCDSISYYRFFIRKTVYIFHKILISWVLDIWKRKITMEFHTPKIKSHRINFKGNHCFMLYFVSFGNFSLGIIESMKALLSIALRMNFVAVSCVK